MFTPQGCGIPACAGVPLMRHRRSCCFADDSAQQLVGADAHIGPSIWFHRNCRASGNAATVSPTARPHKLQATLRSAYVRLSQSRGAKLALLEPHAIPRPAASGRSRPFRCSSSPNCKRSAGLQFGSVCLARKEWGEKRRWRRVILRAAARDFLAAPRPERPDGRKIVIFPIAFGSDNVLHTVADRMQ